MRLLLTDSLRRAEQLFGRREAVVCGDVRLSYAEFGERCRRLAALLRERGVGRGDRVAVLMRNCHRFLEAYTAIPGIGAVIVPLNTRHTVAEHRLILDDCDARMLIADKAFQAVAEQLATGIGDELFAPADYERALAESPLVELAGDLNEDDLAALCYTGGTTGPARGVMLTHRNLVANAFHIAVAFGYDEHDTYLHAAPMFHLADGSSIYALTWRGARHVFLPSFEPAAMLDLIARERVTCTILVPTMIGALVQHPAVATTDVRSLRLIAHGGAPIATDLLRRAVAALGCSFTQAYGLTESSSLISALPHEEQLLDDPRVRSAGRAVMGVEVAIRGSDGTVRRPGEIGEITARGPNFTPGYWNKPEESAVALRDGWFWTGDLGYVDEDGYLCLVDRTKDVIISGGENVHSPEVEEVIGAHPAVAEAAVIGVPDDVWGERVHAVVVARPGQCVEAEVLRAFCVERLAGYKCPRSVELVDALPKSGAGKVLKRELRARHWSGRDRMVH